MQVQAILNEALKLSPLEKAAVIDRLMASFDISQRQRVDEAWAQEVERRIDAYDAGRIYARPAEDVMKEINS
ncbi:MAG: addiction module protein [Desulfococcaceae bacterium]